MIRHRFRLVPWCVCAAAMLLAAESPPPPTGCNGPEWKQLDFWLGEWDLTWPAHGQSPAGTGSNRIEKILGGCVVEESFAANGPSVSGPSPFMGRSLSTYDPRTKSWRQTWVDNQGFYLDFTGGLEGGQMVLLRQGLTPEGRPQVSRMVFTNVTRDSLDWRWERSEDGGKTWRLLWPIHYARRGRAP